MTRYEYTDNVSGSSLTWPTFGLSVFWNYRGTPAYGVFTDGAAFRPHTPSPGQTACPSLISTATDRCVKMQWPFAHSAYDRSQGRTVPGSWQGSNLANKVDGTGLEYARNRVYDAQSGRFTQEDPIGLAGGVNLYGFANGDPSTFSDPFGLCTPFPECMTSALERLGQMAPAISTGVAALTASSAIAGVAGAVGAIAIGTATPAVTSLAIRAAPAAAVAATRLRVEVEDGVATSSGRGLSVMASINRSGGTVTLQKAHIEGPGAGSAGLTAMRECFVQFGGLAE